MTLETSQATASPAHDPAVAGRSWVLAAMIITIFMSALEGTIVATAMPTIISALGGFDLFSWVFTSYLLAMAISTPIYGRLADLYGRKRVLLWATTLFLVGSVLCGFAASMEILIACRVIQGIGAGALFPLALTIIGDIYSPAERARLQGWLSSIWAIAALLGPTVGAAVIANLSWAMIFWVNVPIGLAAIAIIVVAFREKLRHREHRIDLIGAALMTLGIFLLMFALVQASALSAASLAGLVAAAAMALALFAFRERRMPEPMMPPVIWRKPVIVTGNAATLVIGAAMMGTTAFLPLYVQGVMGRSALVAGFALTAISIGWPLGSAVSGRLLLRASYRAAAVAGGIFVCLGGIVMILLDPSRGPLWAGFGAALTGFGFGICYTPYIVSVQSSVDWSDRGAATASNVFARTIGQAIGAAAFGGVLNIGVAEHIAGGGDLLNRILDSGERAAMPPDVVTRLMNAVAESLHNVYLINGALAMLLLVLAFGLPKHLGVNRGAAEGKVGQ
jgi:EmrB/QacA subfamily drug resistance transporter